jgi:hypothetical protein
MRTPCYLAFSFPFFLASLTGCLATIDLAGPESTLSPYHKRVATEISDLTEQSCTTYRHRQGSPEKPITGQVPIRTNAEVKRLYQSSTAWYKAEIAVPRAWANVYYNNLSRNFICGDVSWNNSGLATEIQFTEVK